MVYELQGCGGCSYTLIHVLLRLDVEPIYFKPMVEETRLPGQPYTLVVTGACIRGECVEALHSLLQRASRVILVGCCALNCGIYSRVEGCTPPARVAKKLGISFYSVPGCPPPKPMLEAIVARVYRARRA